MQAYLTLTRRELAGFFVSLTGYIIIAAAVFLMGLSFVDLLVLLQGEATSLPVTQLFLLDGIFLAHFAADHAHHHHAALRPRKVLRHVRDPDDHARE